MRARSHSTCQIRASWRKGVVQLGYMGADLTNASVEIVSGYQLYQGDLSQTAQALNSGQLGYGQYYAEFGANTVTMGTYGEVKAGYQLATGQISMDQFSDTMISTGIMQYAGARMMQAQGVGTTPTRLLGPEPPPVLDPFAGSPMGTTPGGLYASTTAASEAQLSGGYLADSWSMTTLPKGSTVYGGVPGQSAFYTDLATVQASGLDAQSFSQSLQVAPHPLLGYRSTAQAHILTMDMNVPTGTALSNTAFGSGGGTQFFIPKYNRVLVPTQQIPLSK